MTIEEFYTRYSIADNPKEVDKQVERLPRPSRLCGVIVPENLNDISLGKLIMMQQIMINAPSDYDRINGCASILLDVNVGRDTSAEVFFGFGLFIARELQRISTLFDRIKLKPTEEEIQAGIEQLNFGFFGTLDWYCRRMGITDHAEAEKVPWARVYKCMEIDSKTTAYERRLRKIYAQRKT